MKYSNFERIVFVSFLDSLVLTVLIILNLLLFQLNYNFGLWVCSSLNIPTNLSLTSISPGFLNSFLIVLCSIEQYILFPSYDLAKDLMKYFCRFL